MQEDREAITRLKQGDIGGLEPLVRKYQLRATRAAYLVTRDIPVSEDEECAALGAPNNLDITSYTTYLESKIVEKLP